MRFVGLPQQNLEGRKIFPILQVLWEQKAYTQSDDVPASGYKPAGCLWAEKNPTRTGRRQGREEAKQRWRETKSWVQGETEVTEHAKIMFPDILYRPPRLYRDKIHVFQQQ